MYLLVCELNHIIPINLAFLSKSSSLCVIILLYYNCFQYFHVFTYYVGILIIWLKYCFRRMERLQLRFNPLMARDYANCHYLDGCCCQCYGRVYSKLGLRNPSSIIDMNYVAFQSNRIIKLYDGDATYT